MFLTILHTLRLGTVIVKAGDDSQGSMTKEQKEAGLASVFKRDDGDKTKRKELDARMREAAFVPDAYGECYPGYHELGTAVVDDDEADFTAMDSKVHWYTHTCWRGWCAASTWLP